MITKERLEELIDKESCCYGFFGDELYYINLKSEYKPEIFSYCERFYLLYVKYEINNKYRRQYLSENLFETKEEAEEAKWTQKMYASRTIHFKPLMWKDIHASVQKIKNSKEQVYVINVQQFCNGDDIFSLYLVISEGELSIEVTNDRDDEIFKSFEMSEEGYVQAVEWARELFLGECDD